jgi:hypothetical protein
MKKFVFLAPLLLAATAHQKIAYLFDAPQAQTSAAAPAKLAGLTKAKGVKSTATVADVVTAANAFIATLSTAQQTTLINTYNTTNIKKWSNLPCGAQCRIGLQLSSLTATQVTAALNVVQLATGTVAGDGFNETQQIRAADDNLGTQQSGYSSGIYFIAFVGTPSLTGTWQLQYGGHHLATNITYGNGNVTGATPKFEGVEPLNFTTANANVLPSGTACAPLANEESAMLAMLNSLTTAQKATAHLSQTFSDVVLGPGQDGNFPTTKVGVRCNALTAAQQALVLEAMRPWVQDSDDATAAFLMTTYQGQLADTYISYAGTGLFTTSGDYVRIDGPNVWIEFVCQTGVVYRSQIHYHSIWRDHARDYGGNYYTTVTGTKDAAAAAVFAVYPNPLYTGSILQVQLEQPATSATYTLRNTLGQQFSTGTFSGSSTEVPTASLPVGTYLLSIQVAGQSPVTRRVLVN